MSKLVLTLRGAERLIRATKTAQPTMRKRAGVFFARAMREYNRILMRNPWAVGSRGGGVPTDTKNLRDTLEREITPEFLRISETTNYGEYVHDGTRRMKARPFFDYAKEQADSRIRFYEKKLLEDLRNHLS